MSKESLNAFSQDLKEKRESAKISLEEIAKSTRLDIKFLRAIEDGDFEILPDFYQKAFIKSYASSIGLDPEETVSKFLAAKEAKIEQTDVSGKNRKKVKQATEKKAEAGEKKQIKALPWIIFSAIVLIVVAIAGYDYFSEASLKPVDYFYDTINEDSLTGNSDIIVVTSKEKDPVKRLYLTIKCKQKSWIRLITDEETASEFMMEPGQELKFEAVLNYYVLIGNSAGISIELNGNDTGFEGEPETVKSVYLDKDGIKYIRTKDFPENG